MLNHKVKGCKEGSLSTLPAIQLFYTYKASKVVVVWKHLNNMYYAFKVMAKLLEAFNNS